MFQTDAAYKQEPYTILDGKAKGELIGGNLTLMSSLIGTKYNQSYKDKIVFIEEVGERPYRIDRMLTQLIQSTDFAKCKGIILGVFNDCEPKPEEFSFTLRETLQNNLQKLNIPILYGFPFGHVSDISTFPIGIEATINTENMSIEFRSPF
jgi:muramoyltetrapeptide carboxypeptidase